MMDKIEDKEILKLNKLVYNNTKSLFKDKIDIVYFDATTLYFESFDEDMGDDAIRKKGFSKDGKFNQPPDLVVNMTSAGLEDESLPCPIEILKMIVPKAKACVDVIYGKETAFLKFVAQQNKPSKDGSDMLLYQGIIAFEYFCEEKYSFQAIKEEMQKAFIF